MNISIKVKSLIEISVCFTRNFFFIPQQKVELIIHLEMIERFRVCHINILWDYRFLNEEDASLFVDGLHTFWEKCLFYN